MAEEWPSSSSSSSGFSAAGEADGGENRKCISRYSTAPQARAHIALWNDSSKKPQARENVTPGSGGALTRIRKSGLKLRFGFDQIIRNRKAALMGSFPSIKVNEGDSLAF